MQMVVVFIDVDVTSLVIDFVPLNSTASSELFFIVILNFNLYKGFIAHLANLTVVG